MGSKEADLLWIQVEWMKGRYSFHWREPPGFLILGFPRLVTRDLKKSEARESERDLEEAKASKGGPEQT